ncbi:SH3 domain-containing protein [Agrobacterium arsenijevicii]|uniref:SH3 domain-containing protein n=1 Tax=Agrobacterium arsenijevicii TaxID=1585697 RepID=UPI0009E3AF69
MRKRYWIIGVILIYAVVNQMGSKSNVNQDGVATRPAVPSQSGNIEPFKPVPSFREPQPNAPSVRKLERPSEDFPIRFVIGNRVAFRAAPSKNGNIIDRLDSGRRVLLIDQFGEWSHVRDELTRREGWMSSRLLGDKQKTDEDKPSEKVSKTKEREKSIPTIPDSVIIQRIIAESLASYPSSCACPYNTDRGGRRCGKRSAYSKPGGYSPVCFPQDVTSTMIEAFRRQ